MRRFCDEAELLGMKGLRGHRTVGGISSIDLQCLSKSRRPATGRVYAGFCRPKLEGIESNAKFAFFLIVLPFEVDHHVVVGNSRNDRRIYIPASGLQVQTLYFHHDAKDQFCFRLRQRGRSAAYGRFSIGQLGFKFRVI